MTKPEIISLEFGYSGGMEISGNYSYMITNDDDGYQIHSILNSGNTEIVMPISKKKFETLVRLFDGVDLASLKDIDCSSGERALDAANFNFTAKFSDGNICSISSKAAASEALLEAVNACTDLVRKMLKKVRFFQFPKRT